MCDFIDVRVGCHSDWSLPIWRVSELREWADWTFGRTERIWVGYKLIIKSKRKTWPNTNIVCLVHVHTRGWCMYTARVGNLELADSKIGRPLPNSVLYGLSNLGLRLKPFEGQLRGSNSGRRLPIVLVFDHRFLCSEEICLGQKSVGTCSNRDVDTLKTHCFGQTMGKNCGHRNGNLRESLTSNSLIASSRRANIRRL
ncbi:unnamed protein product [Protopolystoma xenopodis]|uniref:Uncharacterized protein n=1 Tax=Protopolystoma xenopodis TaxID=117903 RepID=A0A3S5FGN7_9PLAT|nr:unnamed protein product [Protopolystoma xenopodis]